MDRRHVQRIAQRLLFGWLILGDCAGAATLDVRVHDTRGRPLEGIAIVVDGATPATAVSTAPAASIDQRNEQFVPRISIVQRGSAVAFPNTDRVQHHVYSFSAAKQFELPLYRGNLHPPIVFDRAGVVVLGCNIHDHMIGYVLVVDSPYFAFSDADGLAELTGLPDGPVDVKVWHPDLRSAFGDIHHGVDLEGPVRGIEITMESPGRPPKEASLSWTDY